MSADRVVVTRQSNGECSKGWNSEDAVVGWTSIRRQPVGGSAWATVGGHTAGTAQQEGNSGARMYLDTSTGCDRTLERRRRRLAGGEIGTGRTPSRQAWLLTSTPLLRPRGTGRRCTPRKPAIARGPCTTYHRSLRSLDRGRAAEARTDRTRGDRPLSVHPPQQRPRPQTAQHSTPQQTDTAPQPRPQQQPRQRQHPQQHRTTPHRTAL
mgnify:CR=1 FL=1